MSSRSPAKQMNIPIAISAKEAASKLKFSEQYVRSLLRSGKLDGCLIGRQWVITPEAIEVYITKTARQPANHFRSKEALPNVKALSFFSGAMGLDIGLERAGVSVILACEFDKACRKTIEANHPDIALLGDIRDYTADDVREAAGLTEEDDIELIVGGPPCQAFSTAGSRKGFKDERGNVFIKFIDLILELRPKYVALENVRGLLSAPLRHRPHIDRMESNNELEKDELPGGAMHHLLELLRCAGYGVSFNLYNAANFGSPQVRERVVMICHRGGDKVPYLTPTHAQDGRFGLPQWLTFREAVVGLSNIGHDHVNFSEKRQKFFKFLGPGQYWKHLPEELQKEALGKSYDSGGGKTGFFRRLAWDKPSPTVVTHPAMPATDLCHPEEDRPLSVQEYRRLQEIPDDWVIAGSLIDQYRQLGNAVPVSLGEAIGQTILDHMNGKRNKSYTNFPYSRYKNTDDISWEHKMRSLDSKRMESKRQKQMEFKTA